MIVLICDDFGVGDFEVNNQYAKVPTPNINRLANEGVNFKDAHAGSSRCGPSRYMMMTGKGSDYLIDHNLPNNYFFLILWSSC